MFSQELESMQPQDSSCDKDITDHLEQSLNLQMMEMRIQEGNSLQRCTQQVSGKSEDGIPGCDQSIGTYSFVLKLQIDWW